MIYLISEGYFLNFSFKILLSSAPLLELLEHLNSSVVLKYY